MTAKPPHSPKKKTGIETGTAHCMILDDRQVYLSLRKTPFLGATMAVIFSCHSRLWITSVSWVLILNLPVQNKFIATQRLWCPSRIQRTHLLAWKDWDYKECFNIVRKTSQTEAIWLKGSNKSETVRTIVSATVLGRNHADGEKYRHKWYRTRYEGREKSN